MDFCLFAKNMGKRLTNKYDQKLLDSTKKSTTDAITTSSKRAILKTAEATGDLIRNETTSASNKPAIELHSKELPNNNNDNETDVIRKDTFLQKKGNKLLMN